MTPNRAWTHRFELLDTTLASITSGLAELERRPDSGLTLAWREAGHFQLRFYESIRLVIGRTPNLVAAHEALQALKHDFTDYLAHSHTPISARHCAALTFDPLLEYTSRPT